MSKKKRRDKYEELEDLGLLVTRRAKDPGKGPLVLISVGDVLRKRMPKLYKRVPRWSIRLLERIIHQKEMNNLLRRHHGKRDADFARAVMDDLNIKLEVIAPDGLPDPSDRRIVIVSNHPLGGIDGISMIDFFTRYYGGHIGVVVNDVLSNIDPMNGIFIPVNQLGAQNRKYQEQVSNAFNNDNPIIIFPAGTVSRATKGGNITDVEWRRSFLSWSIRTRRTILPVFFSGKNSKRFYRTYRLRRFLRMKLNFEMIWTPSEVFRGRDKTYKMVVGSPIPTEELMNTDTKSKVAEIRRTVYSLEKYVR